MLADHLSTTFAALADPTRRAILARLASGEASVTELAEPFEMSMPAISKHLKVLEQRRPDCTRPRSSVETLPPGGAPLKDVDAWVQDYRRFWEQSFDRLDDYLSELQDKEKKHARKHRKA